MRKRMRELVQSGYLTTPDAVAMVTMQIVTIAIGNLALKMEGWIEKMEEKWTN